MTLKIHKPKWNLLGAKSRYFIITGGRGSGKSFEVGRFLTILSYDSQQKILFTRKTLTSAHASIIPEFTQKIELLNKENDFEILKTEITNKQSRSEIIFKGLQSNNKDNTANLKSMQGVNNWILDEAEELTDEDTFDKIDLSIREVGKQNRVIAILNPTTKEHFIYKRFFQQAGVPEGFTGTVGDTTYIHSTYLENLENLSESFILRAEKMRVNNPTKYSHIMMGGWLEKAEGVVFTNWKFGAFNPDNLQTSYGQDYGYSIDPTTLAEIAIDKLKKKIYCRELLYKVKLTTSEIAQINNTIAGQKLIIADSAEQRLIDELVKQGNRIVGAKKGPGSIEAGVSLMQDYELIIEGANLAKELNNYVYLDKGAKLYIDAFNHLIDAIRYNVQYNLSGAYNIDIR
jgi:phage terminase large subunit